MQGLPYTRFPWCSASTSPCKGLPYTRYPTPKAILNISYLGLCTELPDQFSNAGCLPSSFPHYFTDPASLTSLGPSVSFPQNRHRRCTGPLKSAGHAFLLLRRWGSPVGDWIPDEPPNCEKHSVANNLGSGEDLSEVVIYSRLQWRAPHKQERAHLLVPKHSLYTF